MHEQTVSILRALADPTRLDIVRCLVKEQEGASCGQVSSCSELSQPAMSHHLGKLVDTGVLLDRKDGKCKFYELNTALLKSHGIDPTKL